MDEQQQSSSSATEQKSNLNPLLIVVILIIVAAVGVMLWLGNNKNSDTSTQTAQQQAAPTAAAQTEQPTAAATGNAVDGAMTEQAISVEGGNFYFKPNQITVKKGQKVKVTFTSAGGMHDFVVDEFNVKTDVISSGSTTVEFTPDKTGTFEFYCSVGMHRKMGMVGKLIVQ